MARKQGLFFGSGVALVTPFRNGEIDYEALEELIDFQIRNGTDAIVLLGTTGEASTINESEREKIIPFAKEKIKGRVPLIVGTGTNSTEVSVRYTKMAQELGANGCLVVTPYYNKATDNGIVAHYEKVAGSVDIPIILYNVPSRTGVTISKGVYRELSKIDNIVGVKEASGSISYMQEIARELDGMLDIYTGNDELTYSTLALGGKGVISVCANVTPSLMHQICYEFKSGNYQKSRELLFRLLPLINELFKEVNPIPVKASLYLMGMVKNEFRLPLCKSTRLSELENVLSQLNLV